MIMLFNLLTCMIIYDSFSWLVHLLQWASPYEVSQQYYNLYKTSVNVAPPQMYETRRLMQFCSVPELLQFAWHLGQHRVERWMPVVVATADTTVAVLPGSLLFWCLSSTAYVHGYHKMLSWLSSVYIATLHLWNLTNDEITVFMSICSGRICSVSNYVFWYE